MPKNKYTQEILKMAEKGYGEELPSYVDAAWGANDGLANFVVVELTECTEDAKSRGGAIGEAHEVILMAITQLREVLGAIQ